jgi:nucleoside-triphosphatase
MTPVFQTARVHLLLTGVPGIGKTTVIRRVAEKLANVRLGGFYTEEIRESGIRRGFRLVDFEGQERIIAHVDFSKHYHVSKYGVDAEALDDTAGSILVSNPNNAIYLVDEIGKMECMSAGFVNAMRILLDCGQTVVATIALRGNGFIDEVKQRRDCVLWEITRANRDTTPARVLSWLEDRVKL